MRSPREMAIIMILETYISSVNEKFSMCICVGNNDVE